MPTARIAETSGHACPICGEDLQENVKYCHECGAAVERLHAGSERFASLLTTPVEEWHECPMCQVAFAAVVDHGAYCGRCGRYYTDSDRTPTLSAASEAPGGLVGSSLSTFPSEMVRHYGFEPLRFGMKSDLAGFGVSLAWRVAPSSSGGVGSALKLDGWLMRQAAASRSA